MAISDHKGKLALATSFAIMTASSTVYAQISNTSPSEGERAVSEQNRQSTQTQIRGSQSAARSVAKSKLAAMQRARSGRNRGELGIGDDTDTAFTEPSFFGPRQVRTEYGMAAGEALEGVGSFANFGLTQSKSTAGGFETDTGLAAITLGFDKAIDDNFILGLAVGFVRSASDSLFSVGTGNFESTNESNSTSFAPYAAYIINENFFVDATLGVSGGENRLNHTNRATGAVVQSGDADFYSRFVGLGVNYTNVIFDDYGLQAGVSYTWSSTERDDFVDDQASTNIVNNDNASQLIIGGQIGRQMGNAVPYVFSYYERDLIRAPRGGGLAGEQAETAPNALRLGVGVDAVFMDKLTASAEVNTLLFKPGYQEVGLTLNVRYDF